MHGARKTGSHDSSAKSQTADGFFVFPIYLNSTALILYIALLIKNGKITVLLPIPDVYQVNPKIIR